MKNPCDPVKMSKLELVLIVDGEGNYGIGQDYDAAKEAYENGDTDDTNGLRVYRLNLAVPLPVASVVTGILPDVPGGEVALSVV